MTKPIRVLFVCLGNICRSPLAQGIFEEAVRTHGLEALIEVDSAGTAHYHVGERPDRRAVAAARDQGIDISHLRGRQLTDEDLDYYDYILAMDRQNLKDIHALEKGRAAARAQIELLLTYHPDPKLADVPDPYYGSDDGFNEVFDLIETACHGFLESLDMERGA